MIYDVGSKKILVCKTFSFGEKGFTYFIGYKDGKKVKPLCVIIPKISTYRRDFDETKYMSFLIKNDKSLEIYNDIWDKVSNTSNTIKKRI